MRRTIPLSAAVLALAGAAVLAGPAAGRAARTLQFESHRGQALQAGYLPATAFNDTGFSANSSIAGACIRRWPGWAVSEANVLIGVRGPASNPNCDASQPITLRTVQNDSKYVSFHLIGQNPAGWTVTAYAANGATLDIRTAPQGKVDDTSRWVSVTDPEGHIASVRIVPAPGSAATVEFGVDNLTCAD